ncbi:restriction endonuclease subunit S [Empedobacter falsenii]|uniref:Restriction endonuclease subunit S n=1 Tax=Empedobacter falsenii TaxID=343874 RepID=A0ABY8V7F6_9FLAO|nr:restriction endonuclease subunit S [Empedobacter falsenii]WIH97521.1 restriction endonuclease subunit S [Empedobacter falsenii]
MENLQPKLRFPEFEEDWIQKPLKDIGEIVGGGTPSTTIEEYWNGEVNWFTPTEITSKYVSSSKRKITDLGVSKSSAKILPKGSILLTTRATIGECSISLEESTTNQGFQSVIVNSSNNNEFIYYLINTLKNELIKNSSGSTFLEISKRKIESISNFFPNLQEQTKIADFLGAVDKQLDILNQKKEKLNLYKKGVMQQLFAQQLRFKDDNGNDYPDWQEKTLGEVTDLITKGTTPKRFCNSGINFIKVESLINCKIDKSKVMYIEDDIHLTSLKRSILKNNDILFSIAGSLGRVALVSNEILPANTNQALSIIRLKENEFHDFYIQLLSSHLVDDYILKNKSIGAQPNLSLEQMKNFKFFKPKNKEEQTKIANFLSAIDTQIETVENQITKTETYKKGLLQQMFV